MLLPFLTLAKLERSKYGAIAIQLQVGNQFSTLIYSELIMPPREQPLSQKLPENKFHCSIENSYDGQISKEVYIFLQVVCCRR